MLLALTMDPCIMGVDWTSCHSYNIKFTQTAVAVSSRLPLLIKEGEVVLAKENGQGQLGTNHVKGTAGLEETSQFLMVSSALR